MAQIKIMNSIRFAILFIAVSLVHCTAHSVWIEPNQEGQLVAYFAEPDGRKEKSPGHLDSLTVPVAWKTGETNNPVTLEVRKQTNCFLLVGSVAGDSAQLETGFPVMASRNGPGRKPFFYARWNPPTGNPAVPALMLDIVPTGRKGEARVFFRGKPLGGIKATLRTPDDKDTELTADADGYLKFDSTQSGLHLLTIAHHREALPGFAGGRGYELTSHNAALTWKQP